MLPGSSETVSISIIYLLGQKLRKHKTKRKISPHLFRADRPEAKKYFVKHDFIHYTKVKYGLS